MELLSEAMDIFKGKIIALQLFSQQSFPAKVDETEGVLSEMFVCADWAVYTECFAV